MRRNKFTKITLLVLCFGFIFSAMNFALADTLKAKITATNVNMRAGAGMGNKVIALLQKTDDIKVLGKEGNWYKVEALNKTGYVSQSYVSNPTNAGNGSAESNYNLLKLGMRNAQVTKLQTDLKTKGFFNVAPTGYFGYITETAVRKLQSAANIKVDGIAGPNTQNALKGNLTNDNSGNNGNGSSKPGSTLNVQKTNWFSGVNSAFARGEVATVVDVSTGLRFQVKRKGGSNHADTEPLTASDTAIMKKIYGGSWSWNRRAVIVITNEGKAFAGSMNGMPHGEQSIGNNGFNGHSCIHFAGSRTHGSNKVDSAHQSAVNVAARVATVRA